MSTVLLVRYIQELVEAHLARVPNQLIAADSVEGERDEDETVDEFAGVAGISGFTGPAGATPDKRKNKPRKK
jgi:hypothetical protein